MLSFLLFILASSTFIACKKDKCYDSPRTFYGPAVALGDDSARSFVTIGENRDPISIGIQFGEHALNTLPTDIKPGDNYPLPLPVQAKASGVDHIEVEWAPAGHDPGSIYGAPHFDFHFYYITQQEQSSVIPGPDTVTVPAQYIPTDYVTDGFAVPNMGVHWTDTTSSEFHGSPFTTTFIYGFYRGKMTFLEPMVTKAFLETHPDFSASVKQPAAFQHRNFYPTSYKVKYDASKHVYLITLAGLKRH